MGNSSGIVLPEKDQDPTNNTIDVENEAATSPAALPEAESADNSLASEQPLVKVCAKCSVQSQTAGNFCPNCGAAFVRKRGGLRINRRIALIVAAVVLIAGGGTWAAVAVQHANQVAAEEKAAAAAAAAEKKRQEEAAAAAEAEAARQEAADDAERELRKLSVKSMEASIQKDAKSRVTDGTLTGPIKRTECTPLGGGSTDDLTAITGTFECIAVNEERKDGSASGYVFSATMNWDEGSYSWHLGR